MKRLVRQILIEFLDFSKSLDPDIKILLFTNEIIFSNPFSFGKAKSGPVSKPLKLYFKKNLFHFQSILIRVRIRIYKC